MTTLCLHGQRQRGAASLGVSMMLLFGMTLAVFYLNRGMLFEQKSSANQARATRAFEMADAGIEWAIARLNSLDRIDTACAAGGTATFMQKYLNPGATAFAVPANVTVGCRVASDGTAVACSCPATGTLPSYGNDTDPRFMVTFNSVAGQDLMVEAVSVGCTAASADCGTSGAVADAVARARILLKVKPVVGNIPAGPLTAGAGVTIGGNMVVQNTASDTNGVTIEAGQGISMTGSAEPRTIAGGLASDSLVSNDATLYNLANTAGDTAGDVMFASFFGKTVGQYKDADKTYRIKQGCSTVPTGFDACCSTDIACAGVINDTFSSTNYSNFYLDGNMTFNSSNVPSGTLGVNASPNYRPVVLVATGDFRVDSPITFNGLLYAATTSIGEPLTYSGSGDAVINGASVSRGSFDKGTAGGLNLIYDPNLLGYLLYPTNGTLARVPGSWRDFQ
jgi:Tfp pilus assembly protein PilX